MKKFILLFLFVFFFLTSIANADIYKVKKGDTLYRVSKKFNVSIDDLKRSNGLTSNQLKVGTELSIPVKEQKSKTMSQKMPSKKGDNPAEQRYHFVVKGDTIKSIAQKYSLSVDELKEINNLKSSKLKIGQQLFVKPLIRTYTVKKGDTIWRIARKFNLDVETLKEMNEMEDESLKIGQKIIVAKETVEPEVQASDNNQNHEPIEKTAAVTIDPNDISNLTFRERIIAFAKKMLNLPYRFGGNTALGIDCSAYVQKVYNLAGINLPRSAREQFHVGESIDRDKLSIGDLVFFRTYASFPSHVGIYLGNNLFIHASSKSKKVTIDSLETPYYFKRFIGAKRLIPDAEAEELEQSN